MCVKSKQLNNCMNIRARVPFSHPTPLQHCPLLVLTAWTIVLWYYLITPCHFIPLSNNNDFKGYNSDWKCFLVCLSKSINLHKNWKHYWVFSLKKLYWYISRYIMYISIRSIDRHWLCLNSSVLNLLETESNLIGLSQQQTEGQVAKCTNRSKTYDRLVISTLALNS